MELALHVFSPLSNDFCRKLCRPQVCAGLFRIWLKNSFLWNVECTAMVRQEGNHERKTAG